MKHFSHPSTLHQDQAVKGLIRRQSAIGYAVYCYLLELASMADGEPMEAAALWLEGLADGLRLDLPVMSAVLDTLADLDLIDRQQWADGQVLIPAIATAAQKHQQRKAQTRVRVQKHRAKVDRNASVTQRNDDVTRYSKQQVEPSSKKRPQKNLTEKDFMEWVALTYNENRPARWAECKACNKDRLKLANRLWEDSGRDKERAIAIMEAALEHCRNDEWWSGIQGSIDKLFRDRRYQEFAEQTESSTNEVPASAPDVMALIAGELRRLNMPGVLPLDWQERLEVVTVGQLSPGDARDYLAYLQGLEVAA
jgi:hypothetical protein